MDLLLNWLFHGVALTLIVALGVRASPRMNAATRERVWWVAISAVTLLPCAYALSDLVFASPGPVATSTGRLVVLPVPSAAWSTAIAVAWATWTLMSLTRVAVGLIGLRRTKSLAAPFPAHRETRLQTWIAIRRSGRPVDLVVSSRIYRAALLGMFRPLIAVAPGLLDRFTDKELDQIVVHEYAHLRRWDDVALLVQRIIMAVAGFHPAVWWLSRALTIEREVACDDWVVTDTHSRSRYAACLVKLASTKASDRWSVAPRAAASRSQLAVRVARLMDPARNAAVARSIGTLRIAAAMILGLVLISAAIPLVGFKPGGSMRPMEDRSEAAAHLPVTIPDLGVRDAERFATATSKARPARRASASIETTAGIRVETDRTPRSNGGSFSRPGSVDQAHAPAASAGEDLLTATPLGPYRLSVERANGEAPVHALPGRQIGWKAVGAFGIAVGDRSREGAVKTASLLSRIGRSFASPF